MEKINPELFKGSAATVVLMVLSNGKKYGYELIKEVDIRSNGALELKEGTLYPVLHQLEKDGAIRGSWEKTESSRKRKFYDITSEGRKVLARRKSEWTKFRGVIDQLLVENPVVKLTGTMG